MREVEELFEDAERLYEEALEYLKTGRLGRILRTRGLPPLGLRPLLIHQERQSTT